MLVNKLARDSFIMLPARLPLAEAARLLALTQATHLILHRMEIIGDANVVSPEVKEYYYLYTFADALNTIATRPQAKTVFEAFNLHEYTATATIDRYTSAALAPSRAVVTDRGRVVGFIDTDLRPDDWLRKDAFGSSGPEPRLLTADLTDQIPLNESRSLLVTLSAVVDAITSVPGARRIDVAIGETLTIIVLPPRGLRLEGDDEASFVVTEKEHVCRFKVKAVELGPGELHVLAFSGAQCVCKIILQPTVVEAGQAASPTRSAEGQPVVVRAASDPDLSLLIFEREEGGKPSLTFLLKALDPALKFNFKHYGPVKLQKDTAAYFQDFFQEIENLPLQTDSDREIAQYKLAGKGAELFQNVIPEPLQKDLWSSRARIRTVQVQSQEPWIPWELCKLQGEKDGRIDPGMFFCEAFEITRWLLEVPVKPALRVKNMALIIPKNSGLRYAAQERDYMLSLNAPPARAVTRLPATFLGLKQALIKGEYDAWHFTGHGGFSYRDPNCSAMQLEDGQNLTPQDLNDNARNMGLSEPLVFLNACQIGRGDMSLTGIGGWANQFLQAGAAAFVGAYWSIYDQSALEFAKAFYSRLLTPMPIGRAIREARLAIKPLGDPTWLAYTVWANPAAAVEV